MATMFEPSLSANMLRTSHFSTSTMGHKDAPLSMADSLPSINFGFADLQSRILAFQEKFDTFIASSRQRVLEDRNRFRITMADLQEDHRTKKRDLDTVASKTADHARSIQLHDAETTALRAEVNALSTQREQASAHRDGLRSQITRIRSDITKREAAQSAHAHDVEAQSRLNTPELEFWETHLGMKIEGTDVIDRLQFVFCNLDERKWDREATFELDTTKREYAVLSCKPKLDQEAVDACLEVLNQGRDLGPFLKKLRMIFVAAMKA